MFSQFITYNFVGIINTCVGFSIIFLLMYWGLSATLSNMIGYAIGAWVSYRLNSHYTFKQKTQTKALIVKFFMVLVLAYLLNFVTLQWLLERGTPYMAQIGAAIVYTVSSFILARYFVFKEVK